MSLEDPKPEVVSDTDDSVADALSDDGTIKPKVTVVLSTKEEDNSPFIECKVKMSIRLEPSQLANVAESIASELNSKLLKYDVQLNGMWVSYRDAAVISEKASFYECQPVCYAKIRVIALIFCPTPGMYLDGLVNAMSLTHIGVLVFGTVNATIPKDNLPASFTCNELGGNEVQWYDTDSSKQVELGSRVRFVVIKLLLKNTKLRKRKKDALILRNQDALSAPFLPFFEKRGPWRLASQYMRLMGTMKAPLTGVMEDDGEFDETWKAVAEEDKVEEAGEDEAVAATTKKDKAADVKKEKTIIKEEKASIIKTETNEEEEDTPATDDDDEVMNDEYMEDWGDGDSKSLKRQREMDDDEDNE